MVEVVNEKDRWKSFLQKQSAANASHWVKSLEKSADPEKIVVEDYDNLLRALENSLKNPNNFSTAFSLIQSLFPYVFEFGDWDRWLAYLSKALLISKEHKSVFETARLFEQTADILLEKGLLEDAINNYEKSIQKYNLIDNVEKAVYVKGKIISILDLQGNTTEAISLGNEALKLLAQSPDIETRAYINMILANVFNRSRQWELGLELATSAFNSFQSTNNKKFIARALVTILASQAELSMWDEVKKTSVTLNTIFKDSNNKRSMVSLEITLGASAYQQKNLNEAEVHWQKARHLLSQLREQSTMGIVCNNLGKLYLDLGEWEDSEQMLKEAIAIYAKLGIPLKWANSMDNLAELYEAMGDTAACRQTLLEGIAGLDGRSDAPYAFELLDMMRQRLADLPDED